jgi:hypothetical protein
MNFESGIVKKEGVIVSWNCVSRAGGYCHTRLIRGVGRYAPRGWQLKLLNPDI